MSVLSGKNILLGVTAGIAAYKTTYLVRLFIKAGAHVKVIMTPASKDFVTPLTLSTLSKNPVYSTFYDKEEENELWNNHVELALWADYFIIAPATANTLSKMVNGICDNLLLATYLSAKCKVYFAPAMDLDMYKHNSTKENLQQLESFGNVMIPAESGELASGLEGEGRMAEPENILSFIEKDIISGLPLRNKKVLITAGPTHEAIDPVRFIGNHSSGKMGFELAKEAANLGAEVILISGPSNETTKHSLIKRIDVVTAEEMYNAVHQYYNTCNIAILSAAVADFKPSKLASDKIKKKDAELSLKLVPTKDILASLGEVKDKQFLVGFALETSNELENAKGKLKRKNLDLIVLNSLNDKGAGFKKPTNKITIIDADENPKKFDTKSKSEVAKDIFNEILKKYNA
ncbi:bifunctional phosphopantothenoylcysteine decarboxylase/phosphopantothenate--cysteine ligase CoaBC [Aureibaculum sp. 2210JD6-5]|uniref:bifunctional phosphopantothenoylcysteine decarboxylase/phosphopantothenate--cysteine ligase CoaBC n=1 Tax=Aureibaculum sp. 2210JD6-5 TaxID=3103957 RepID=UPI002AAEAA22|nr:bifunctional phosphopantothenoylcysteine decarboxylase/phosphopantothenate--cysteine ligase CoaBC [Aureibaculum sp. 2210JD6-5]MDY7395479.1 bifunctional phosphopantothenoylcysteine decarboxylase/phosphopantothenate--cysteine ligase CoaBC [Aureibaculum sp. 2210JD6-5]